MENITNMREFTRNTSVESDSDMSGDEGTEVFQDYLHLAEREDRLIKGVFECAHVLEICPEVIELCILPSVKSQNISTRIQHKLIEAYCWENDIQILALDQTEFNQMIKTPRNKSIEVAAMECVLITAESVAEIDLDGGDDGTDGNFG